MKTFSHCLLCKDIKLRPTTWDAISFYCGYKKKKAKSGGWSRSHYRVGFSSGFTTTSYEEEYSQELFGTMFYFYVYGKAEEEGYAKYNRISTTETKIVSNDYNDPIILNRFFDSSLQEELDFLQNIFILK